MFSHLPRIAAVVGLVASVTTANAAPPEIILRLDPAQAAAVQDAMDARSRLGSPRATSVAFWEVEAKLERALAADPKSARGFEDAYKTIPHDVSRGVMPIAGDVR